VLLSPVSRVLELVSAVGVYLVSLTVGLDRPRTVVSSKWLFSLSMSERVVQDTKGLVCFDTSHMAARTEARRLRLVWHFQTLVFDLFGNTAVPCGYVAWLKS